MNPGQLSRDLEFNLNGGEKFISSFFKKIPINLIGHESLLFLSGLGVMFLFFVLCSHRVENNEDVLSGGFLKGGRAPSSFLPGYLFSVLNVCSKISF